MQISPGSVDKEANRIKTCTIISNFNHRKSGDLCIQCKKKKKSSQVTLWNSSISGFLAILVYSSGMWLSSCGRNTPLKVWLKPDKSPECFHGNV